jgi:hypothetical protein
MVQKSMCIALVLLALPASAQTVYDRRSDPIGHYSQEGGRTVFRDNAGNPHGYWQPEGGYIVHRDNAGNLIDKVHP